MFKVAVINFKDLLKFLILIFLLISLITFYKEYFKKERMYNLKEKIIEECSRFYKKSISTEIPAFTIFDSEGKGTKLNHKDKTSSILDMELGALSIFQNNENVLKENDVSNENSQENNNNESKENNGESQNDENNIVYEDTETNDSTEVSGEKVSTEVVTKNPLVDAYNKKYKGVKIKNETKFDLTDDILNFDNFSIDKSNIIIFHTHTCESYTESEKFSYTPTGNFRTTDLKYSVARVGDELAKNLKKYDINVVHDKTYHDYPSYTGSYSRSLKTVTNLLKDTKADIIIDLHRDAIGSYSSYAPTVKIGDDYCAQIMFVIGTNGGGLEHPNWKSNLEFAVKMQKKGNELYPNFFKPIILRNSRYNQHLSKAACIIEVGSTGNTLDQCLNSMKYLAEVINQL